MTITVRKCVSCHKALTAVQYYSLANECPYCKHKLASSQGFTYSSDIKDRRKPSGTAAILAIIVMLLSILLASAHACQEPTEVTLDKYYVCEGGWCERPATKKTT